MDEEKEGKKRKERASEGIGWQHKWLGVIGSMSDNGQEKEGEQQLGVAGRGGRHEMTVPSHSCFLTFSVSASLTHPFVFIFHSAASLAGLVELTLFLLLSPSTLKVKSKDFAL